MNAEIRAYLRRIGLDAENNLSHKLGHKLSRLQEQHLKTVPYENLDIMRGVPISLKTSDLFDKIVSRRRGGFCFELNGLFAWLLRGLGYKVKEHQARYMRHKDKIPMRKHRILTVESGEKKYVCDVGMGSVTPMTPLPLVFGQVTRQEAGSYKFEKEPNLGNVLYEWAKGDYWRRVYSFTDESQLDIDFVMPSFYCEMHPDSPFRQMDMVHMFAENGRKTVAGREVRIYTPKGVEVIVPGTEKMYKELLLRHFGLDIGGHTTMHLVGHFATQSAQSVHFS